MNWKGNTPLWSEAMSAYLKAYASPMPVFSKFLGPITPPTRWQRIRYQLKRPWWAFQGLVRKHICDCDC